MLPGSILINSILTEVIIYYCLYQNILSKLKLYKIRKGFCLNKKIIIYSLKHYFSQCFKDNCQKGVRGRLAAVKTAAEGKWTAVKITPALCYGKKGHSATKGAQRIYMSMEAKNGNICAAGFPREKGERERESGKERVCVNQVNRSDAIRDYYAITQDTINNAPPG